MVSVKRLLIEEEPIEVGASAVYRYSRGLENKLSRVDRFGDPYKLCKVLHAGTDNAMLLVPRCLAGLGGKDRTSYGEPVDLKMKNFTPRENQLELVPQIESYVRQAQDTGHGFILEAGTGIGKTVLGLYAAAMTGRKTLIIVDQENIKVQWKKAIKHFLGLDDSQIGIMQADKCDVVGKPIVIAMVHSISKPNRYPSWVYSLFGTIIADEVHVMAADQFSNAMWYFPARVRIGLSATVDRKDGREVAFIAHIGTNRIVKHGAPLVPKIIVLKSDWKCPVRPKKNAKGEVMRDARGGMLVEQIPHGGGKTMHMNKMLAKHKSRNEMMANLICEAWKKGRNILVLSELMEGHLPLLKDACIKAGVPPKDIGFYVGGKSEKELEEASGKSVVLATFKMTNKAVDCPWWDTLVLATPRSDVRQAIGRVLRFYDGKVCALDQNAEGRVPIIIDVVDADSDVFAGYWEARAKEYRSRGAPMKGDMGLIGRALRGR